MKTYLRLAFAILSLVLGTTAIVAPSHADPGYQNNGNNDHG
jgi:hypothetical protein